jgi:hypothetical protein
MDASRSAPQGTRAKTGQSIVLGIVTGVLCAAHFVPISVRAEPTSSSDSSADDRVVVPSILQHGDNGSYVYRGSGFDAQIAPNGSVTMRNRYGRLQPFGGSFDLTAIAEAAAGNDPYLSERRAFFDATRAFREALIGRADRSTLVRQLTAIRFDRRLSVAERRARTFALWDDMVEDEKGAEGREILQTFVRSQYTGLDQFSAQELEAFNRHRRSRQIFAP